MGDAGTIGNFELLYTGKANDVIPVLKYKSKSTGLTVVIAKVGGPIVNGYFCLATEAHDDDGLPHTLEHLVFMGSEKYPFKGVLDLLANRCLASGTNAWTDTDHTCYTMTTAGSQGFLNLMPVFLDHVLYPTLTEAGYRTEVHHVNGDGEDAGVVYCEMQARENTGESRTHLELLRAMYPGQCGYKSETGGMLRNLRESTSHEKVCRYHRDFYRPENLCLVVTGQVEPEEVFTVLSAFEDNIISKGERPAYLRPWQEAVPELPGSVEQVVPYPSDDEQHGMVVLGWRGPNAQEHYAMSAVLVLMEYLTDTSVSPFMKHFVEVDQPFCSKVRYSLIENSEGCIQMFFENVAKAHLTDVKDKTFDLLAKLSSGAEAFDMERMSSVVHRRVLESLNALEEQPHDTVAFHVIGEFLYGRSAQDMNDRLNQVDLFRKLKKEPQDFWINLIKKYFVDQKSVTVLGEPSQRLMEEMGKTEKERVESQRAALGEGGLKERGTLLEEAIRLNEKEPSQEVLTSVDVPDVGGITFHKITASHNHDSPAANPNEKFPLADIPVAFQLDDIQTNFVNVYVTLNTEDVPVTLKPYLPLYCELILECPVLRDGVVISHQEVVKELMADTVYNGASLGVGGTRFSPGQYPQFVVLQLKLEVEKYEKGVQWLRQLLYQVQFPGERIKIVGAKMANDVSRMKRKGNFIVRTLTSEVLFNKESNHYQSSLLRQHSFLTKVIAKVDEAGEEVCADLEKLRSIVTRPSNVCVHVAAHVDTLSARGDPGAVWRDNFLPKTLESVERKRPVAEKIEKFMWKAPEGPYSGLIAGIGAVESSFMIQTVPCLSDFDSPDLPAIMVFLQYLTQLEGPMWKQIRGLGLSYHYSMYTKVETGLLYFLLARSTHLVHAYKQAKDIVDSYVGGGSVITEVELDTCKSSLVFEIIEKEQTPAHASIQSMLSYLKCVPQGYNKTLIERVFKVSLADLKRVGAQYVAPVFDTKQSKCALVCHPTKVDQVVQGFKEFDRELKVIPNLEESFLAEP